MKKQNWLILAVLMISLGTIGLMGCSSETTETDQGIVQDIVDSVASPAAEQIAEGFKFDGDANEAETEVEVTYVKSELSTDDPVSHFRDMIIVGSKSYAVYNGGMLVYDFKEKSETNYKVDDLLQAVTWHEGKVYAAGEKLYSFDENGLIFIDGDFDGAITELYSYDYRLMIGTESGLYSRGIFGKEKLMETGLVTSMTADKSALWIGTDGEGLYRWDGENFKKRFLLRDSSFFDNIYTLDFQHGHLYMGTENGFHIYNGGSWTTLTVEDGLPVDKINSIDASDWVVYLATDKGVVSYFNDELCPVNKLEGVQVNVIKRRGLKLVAATEYEGIYQKSGNAINKIVQPIREFNKLSLSWAY